MELNQRQLEAVNCIDHNLQIIACAGSGKTEVITRRIVNILLADPNAHAENIVAFTFTEKAALNMRDRIEKHLESSGLSIDINDMFIGTIHSFCKFVLDKFTDEYVGIRILDTVKEHLFISKYNKDCGASTLGLTKSLRDAALFSECIDKMIYYSNDMEIWPEVAKKSFEEYRNILKKKGFINFSFLIYELLSSINSSDRLKEYFSSIKYLVVDEYQDVDDLQESLIRRINGFGAKVCVVGDDDQTIYQFRGSNADNMIGFSRRYNDVVTINLDINYRSDKAIIDIADKVIKNNSRRLAKSMVSDSANKGIVDGKVEETEDEEYKTISRIIRDRHNSGCVYSDMAILLRKRSTLQRLISKLEENGIPCQADITDEFFTSQYYEDFCAIFDYLIEPNSVNKSNMVERWSGLVDKALLKNAFRNISRANESNSKFAELFKKFTEDSGFYSEENKKYIDAFSRILEDFDSVFQNDSWFVRTDNLKYFIGKDNGAKNEYKYADLLGNSQNDAVNILTVHKSKGLEYEVVLIPDLQEGYFPSSKRGGKKYYSVLGGIFEETKDKYETDLEDERKLFYVAVTRARKELYLFANTEKKDVSTFLREALESRYLNIYIPESKKGENQMATNTIEEEEYIDIKALREDLLDDLYAAAHVAHFGGAYIAAEEARRASDDELIRLARSNGFKPELYKKKRKK